MSRKLKSEDTAHDNAPETVSLDIYLQEINRFPLMSRQEEREVGLRAKDGDKDAIDRLVCANLRFVVSVAKRYANQWIPIEDLINEGNLGLVKAAHRFDVDRGYKFISYAVWWIRQAMLQSLSQSSRIVRVPLYKASLLYKIGKASRELDQALERGPTVEEIASELNVPAREVEETMNIPNLHVSLDEKLYGDPDESAQVDYLVDELAVMPDEQTEQDGLRESVRKALSTLTDREQEVMRLYYGLDGTDPLTLEEIGVRLGVTRERIRQVKDQAIQRLRHRSREKYFEGIVER